MILISEVAGAGRWSQFNLLLDWVERFFDRPYHQGGIITLWTVDAQGNLKDRYETEVIYKAESSNWAFEIPGAAEIDYPGTEARPILVLKKRGEDEFSFDLVMPAEGRYVEVREFLLQVYQTPDVGRLKRAILTDEECAGVLGCLHV